MIIDRIENPNDIKKLNLKELEVLSGELREEIIAVTRLRGGHLASNLGTIELTLALLYVFDPESDKMIFDVGHQSYAYKILTGRREAFSSLRTKGGISGFPKMSESKYDAFDTGHASTSVSVGFGMSVARDLLAEDFKVVSIIGDGALSSGLAIEGLNNLVSYLGQFLLILNDNGMSISKNVGGLSQYLSKIRANKHARRFKNATAKFVGRIPLVGKKLKNSISSVKDNFFLKHMNGRFFESMGINYYGAIDGHNLETLIDFLTKLKDLKKPSVLHIKTVKGKGLKEAEASPEFFHGVSKDFSEKAKDFSEIAGETLLELAKKDRRVLAISAGMVDGTGMGKFAKELDSQLMDVGICESHAVTFAAGLAVQGLLPYVAIYSSFLQRAFDQLYHDVSLTGAPVKLLVDRAGLVGNDGATHQGVLDLNFLLSTMNFAVASPKDGFELKEMIKMSASKNFPLAIRYPRGIPKVYDETPFSWGKWEILTEMSEIALICHGSEMVKNALEAFDEREPFTVVNARFLNPGDDEMLMKFKDKTIVTLCDTNKVGGLGDYISSEFSRLGVAKFVHKLEIDKVASQGTTEEQQRECGLDPASIKNFISKLYENHNLK